jgi:hypothetical protein
VSESADLYAEGDPFIGWNEANEANDDGAAVQAAERQAEAEGASPGPGGGTGVTAEPGAWPRGTCEFCQSHGAHLVAVLSADPDQAVCEACHADPRLPTVSLAAVSDTRPVWVVSRGDIARMAGRQVSDEEAGRVARGIEHSTAQDAVADAVLQVCGYPPGSDEE